MEGNLQKKVTRYAGLDVLGQAESEALFQELYILMFIAKIDVKAQ